MSQTIKSRAEEVLSWWSEGVTIQEIARRLNTTTEYAYEVLRCNDDARYAKAREVRGEALVGEAMEIVDNADCVTATLARARSQMRQWLASRLSAQYADKQQLEVRGEIAVTPVINIQLPAPDTEHVQLIENKEIKEKE